MDSLSTPGARAGATGALLLGLLAAALGWSAFALPWRFIDDEWDMRHADAMSAATGTDFFTLGVRVRDLPNRRFMPGFHLLKWSRVRLLGRDVRAHKLARILTMLALALWVRSVVARAGGGGGWALAAGALTLAFPTQLECYFALSPPEAELALLFALFCEAALLWTRPGASAGWLALAAATLLAMLSIKETCVCVALPLAVLTGLCAGAPAADRPRLARGLAVLWVVLLGYAALIAGVLRWLATPKVAAHYDPGAATVATTMRYLAGLAWWKSALLFPLAAAGLARGRPRCPPSAWPAAMAGAMGLAAVAIILPWPVREVRYLALGLPGLAVLVALGLARLPGRGPAGAVVRLAVAGSALWTVAQLAADLQGRIALHERQDGCVWRVMEVFAARCPPDATIVHVCPDAKWRSWSSVLENHLATFARRPDLKVVPVDLQALSPAPWLLVTERDGAAWPEAARWTAARGYREVLAIDGVTSERALGDPRGVARQLARRAAHAAGLGPPDPRPLLDGFDMRWSWRVLTTHP